MKILNLLETKNPGYKAGEPYWELDVENKVYTVHKEDGTEVSRYVFQHVWDSSPAMRKAKEDYKVLYAEYRNRKKANDYTVAQSKPLSELEKRYLELDSKVNSYRRYIYPKTPEDNILDQETRELYAKTSIKWMEQMNRMASGGTIRKSLIDGTYRPAA